MAFDQAMEVVWSIVSSPEAISGFLGAASGALGIYLKTRGARTIRLQGGGVKIELKGQGDIEVATRAFKEAVEAVGKKK